MQYVQRLFPKLCLGVFSLYFSMRLQAEHVVYLSVPEGALVSVLAAPDGAATRQNIKPFLMRSTLVSVADFERFVQTHPYWQRGHGAMLLQGNGYLQSWSYPDRLGDENKEKASRGKPVTEVSWYAARAYCQAEGGRLPNWFEWEYVAAADKHEPDARHLPNYGQNLINTLKDAANIPAGNFYGIRQMHGALWEWVEDYQSLFAPNADPRDPGTGNQLGTCGGAALAFRDRSDFTMMMRIAALSSMQPDQSSSAISFRCVRDP